MNIDIKVLTERLSTQNFFAMIELELPLGLFAAAVESQPGLYLTLNAAISEFNLRIKIFMHKGIKML